MQGYHVAQLILMGTKAINYGVHTWESLGTSTWYHNGQHNSRKHTQVIGLFLGRNALFIYSVGTLYGTHVGTHYHTTHMYKWTVLFEQTYMYMYMNEQIYLKYMWSIWICTVHFVRNHYTCYGSSCMCRLVTLSHSITCQYGYTKIYIVCRTLSHAEDEEGKLGG